MAEYIYHIALEKEWKNALECGEYLPGPFTQEGFIHCSTRDQVVQSANRHFHAQYGLLLVKINLVRTASEIRYEPPQGESFPHIYGPLNLDAVVSVSRMEPDPDGNFHFPAE